MDGRQFDEFTRDFVIPTRRSVIAAAATAVLTALVGRGAADDALARRKQRKPKSKKQQNPRRRHEADRVQASAKKKKRCKGGRIRCGKRCVNKQTDHAHCGQCGNACTGPRKCVAGACTCIPGTCACLPATADLQATIDAASPGATISLCAGTFRTNAVIAKDLTLAGAGPGQTMLDGVQAESAVKVGSDITVTLQDLTTTNGRAGWGGGINTNGALTLKNIVVMDNHATAFGGGIYNDVDGTLRLEAGRVEGNTSRSLAGGIRNDGMLTLVDSDVTGNSSNFDGAGIYNIGTLTLIDSRVSGNTARGDHTAGNGGGIFNEVPNPNFPGTVTLKSSQVSGNDAHQGGGIRNGLDGTLTMVDCTVTDNTAAFGGGVSNNGTLTLTRSSVENNTAGSGGGISNDRHIFKPQKNNTVTLEESRVSGNTAQYGSGGGIDNHDTLVLKAGSTVTGNTARYQGGGIWNIFQGTVTLGEETSVSGNTASEGQGGGLYTDYGTLTLEAGSRVTNNTATEGGGIFNNPRLPTGGVVTLAADDIVTANHLTDGTTPSNCAPVGTIPNCIG